MKKLLHRLFPSDNQPTEMSPTFPISEVSQAHLESQRITETEREMQLLRMELEARDRNIEQMTQELTRLRERQQGLIAETVSARLEALVGELAGPASQVRTQAYLSEIQNKPVHAEDVLAVTRRMIRALERHGVVFEGEIGEQVPYDPNRHTPINSTSTPRVSNPVTVRFSAVVYQGKIVYKAIVE